MISIKLIKLGIYFGIILFLFVIVAGVYEILSITLFEIFKVFIFTISVWYFFWFYKITKSHVPSYNRVAEGALICAILFNPFMQFNLNLALWIFLEAIFLWVFIIFLTVIRKIDKNLKEGNLHWLDME